MGALQNMIMGFVFSFVGSIPPGSINLSVIQLSLQRHFNAALRFGLAAALVEFVYATIAIKLQIFITNNPAIQSNFKLISAIVLVGLGLLNLFTVKKKSRSKGSVQTLTFSGFRRGMLIALANPLAMPFWIAVTAYLQSNSWVNFDDISIWTYVLGISLGTMTLLATVAVTAYKSSKFINKDNKYIKIIPGLVLLSLGLYSLGELYLL